ncbi:hypothetical protein CEXT_348811 [Caerostris extrusa]|uniref:Uncharacterized protein n=1 Tax=Caerostris extrusa TaxID=172846 RepID=A0AAV4XP98_CAEEX|nr:hypothetical protein CEXT_348811 [Caerostris extrusa]
MLVCPRRCLSLNDPAIREIRTPPDRAIRHGRIFASAEWQRGKRKVLVRRGFLARVGHAMERRARFINFINNRKGGPKFVWREWRDCHEEGYAF